MRTPRLLYIYLLLFASLHISAQTGRLSGQIRDDSGALVPSAHVDLTGLAGFNKSTVSNGTGAYSFSGLPPGPYSVQASAARLAQPHAASITIKPGNQTLDLRLSVAKLSKK